MLKKPDAGWSEITIGDWTDRCSYLDDVPIMLLGAVKFILQKRRPRVLRFDAEGWVYYIMLDFYNVSIISKYSSIFGDTAHGDMTYKHRDFDIHITTLADELVSDIRENIDEWAAWFMRDRGRQVAARRRRLENLCNAVEHHSGIQKLRMQKQHLLLT